MIAGRMSSANRGITSFKIIFCDLDKHKTSGRFVIITKQNTVNTKCFHDLLASRITPSQLLPSNFFTNSLFHIHKNIDFRTIPHYNQLIGTVIQKSLKVPEWQMLVLHSQAGDYKHRICDHYHQ